MNKALAVLALLTLFSLSAGAQVYRSATNPEATTTVVVGSNTASCDQICLGEATQSSGEIDYELYKRCYESKCAPPTGSGGGGGDYDSCKRGCYDGYSDAYQAELCIYAKCQGRELECKDNCYLRYGAKGYESCWERECQGQETTPTTVRPTPYSNDCESRCTGILTQARDGAAVERDYKVCIEQCRGGSDATCEEACKREFSDAFQADLCVRAKCRGTELACKDQCYLEYGQGGYERCYNERCVDKPKTCEQKCEDVARRADGTVDKERWLQCVERECRSGQGSECKDRCLKEFSDSHQAGLCVRVKCEGRELECKERCYLNYGAQGYERCYLQECEQRPTTCEEKCKREYANHPERLRACLQGCQPETGECSDGSVKVMACEGGAWRPVWDYSPYCPAYDKVRPMPVQPTAVLPSAAQGGGRGEGPTMPVGDVSRPGGGQVSGQGGQPQGFNFGEWFASLFKPKPPEQPVGLNPQPEPP